MIVKICHVANYSYNSACMLHSCMQVESLCQDGKKIQTSYRFTKNMKKRRPKIARSLLYYILVVHKVAINNIATI